MRRKASPSASTRTPQDGAAQAKVKPTQRAARIKGNMTRAPGTKLVAANVQLRVPVLMSLAQMKQPPKTTNGSAVAYPSV